MLSHFAPHGNIETNNYPVSSVRSHLLGPGVRPVSPEVLHAGGDTGQGQPAQQDHKDPSNVGDAEAGGLATVTFLLNRIAGGR